jgi:nitrate reductase alpha subunit
VQAILVEHAKNAAEKVVELASSDNDVLAFKASQDILDRTGNRPVDIVEHRHRMVDALQVVFIKRDANESIPTIDVEATHVDCQ